MFLVLINKAVDKTFPHPPLDGLLVFALMLAFVGYLY